MKDLNFSYWGRSKREVCKEILVLQVNIALLVFLIGAWMLFFLENKGTNAQVIFSAAKIRKFDRFKDVYRRDNLKRLAMLSELNEAEKNFLHNQNLFMKIQKILKNDIELKTISYKNGELIVEGFASDDLAIKNVENILMRMSNAKERLISTIDRAGISKARFKLIEKVQEEND